MSETNAPTRESFLYKVARALAAFFLHTLMPSKMTGAEKLKREAPFILISNHNSMLDPFVLAYKVKRYPITFLGKKELGKNKLVNRILTSAHVILVGRGDTDMAAMRNCMKAVKMKKILLIFPEGTRHHKGQMEEIQNGTSLIAMRSGAPIIPIYIDRKMGFFKKTNMYVGEPIPYDDLKEKGINTETCEEMNERFRETYRKMITAVEPAEKKK